MTRLACAPFRAVISCAVLAAGGLVAGAAPSVPAPPAPKPLAPTAVTPTPAMPTPVTPTPVTPTPPAPKPLASKPVTPEKPATIIGAAKYRTAIEKLDAAVRSSARPRPALSPLLPPSGNLRRADGQTQSVDNRQWQRSLGSVVKKGRAGKDHVEMLSGSLQARSAEVQRWQKARYEAADAKAIINQLSSSGQIRVGPTQWQLWIKSVRDWWANLIDKIEKWLFGRAPTVRPAKLPQIDGRWIKFFFYSTVFSLLAIIAYMVWKALGGRVGRRGARLEDRVLEGEDAELLKLPSDELLARAAGYAGQVNYREAVRHRFIATLVRFDERALWRYNTRRTNREHIALLRENAARTALAPPLESLARRFDRVRYGNAEASHSDWLQFDSDATQLEAMPAARAEFSATTKPAKGARAS